MKRSFPALCVLSLVVPALLGPGCAISDLKNTNRRLKEANDKLVAENNRLEQELAASEKEVGEKAKKIEALQGELDGMKSAPAATAVEEPVREKGKAKVARDDFEDLGTGVTVTRSSQGIHLRLEDKVFFPQGQATLSKKGETILRTVASKLNSRYRGRMIRVEGHTDDVPVNKVKNKYPSNWELSTARACTVVRNLVDRGHINPTRIYPAGFAYYKPIASAKTASARSQNRRVEIIILNEQV